MVRIKTHGGPKFDISPYTVTYRILAMFATVCPPYCCFYCSLFSPLHPMGFGHSRPYLQQYTHRDSNLRCLFQGENQDTLFYFAEAPGVCVRARGSWARPGSPHQRQALAFCRCGLSGSPHQRQALAFCRCGLLAAGDYVTDQRLGHRLLATAG